MRTPVFLLFVLFAGNALAVDPVVVRQSGSMGKVVNSMKTTFGVGEQSAGQAAVAAAGSVKSSAGEIAVSPCDDKTVTARMDESIQKRTEIADTEIKKAADLSCLDKYKNLNIAASFGVFDASRYIAAMRNQTCQAADSAFGKYVSGPSSSTVWSTSGGNARVTVTPTSGSGSVSTSTYGTTGGINPPNIFK